MPTTTLPPPPVNDKPGSFAWLEWYRQLRAYVSTSGSVPWYIINFAGSNITDIALRDHNQLQGVQGGTTGQKFHLTQDQYSAISNSLELLDTTTTQTLPLVPTVFKPPTTVLSSGITYNSSTGEIVFNNGGSYSFTLMLNANPSGASKTVYFYAEIDTGSGYAIRQYSARSRKLLNIGDEQTLFTSANYFPKGTKVKLFVWADSANIDLHTIDVPGTTPGTVTIPAVRVMFAGSL